MAGFERIVVVCLVAVAASPSPAATGAAIEVLSTQLRPVQNRTGSSRQVTVRAAIDPSNAVSFDSRTQFVGLTVADAPPISIGPGTKGWHARSGGRVKWKQKRAGAALQITRVVLWAARGTVKIVVSGGRTAGSPLGADPAPVLLSLGGAEYFGSLSFVGEPPVGTPLPFTRTDTFPETFLCSPQTVIVATDADWTNVWEQHSAGTRPKPFVDFTKDVVVCVFLGNRENRGYAAGVTQVSNRDEDVLVTYTEVRPTNECSPSPRPVCLYAFATIAKTPKPIRFSHAVALDCF